MEEVFLQAERGITPVSYTHLDVYKRQDADTYAAGFVVGLVLDVSDSEAVGG